MYMGNITRYLWAFLKLAILLFLLLSIVWKVQTCCYRCRTNTQKSFRKGANGIYHEQMCVVCNIHQSLVSHRPNYKISRLHCFSLETEWVRECCGPFNHLHYSYIRCRFNNHRECWEFYIILWLEASASLKLDTL